MEYNVYLKGGFIPHKVGANYKEKLSEDLDIGQIIFPHLEEIEINQFDEIELVSIETNSSTKKMLIADIDEEIIVYEDTQKMNYIVGLVSPTIKLQRIILPNRMITHSLIDEPQTIIEVVEQYLSIYAPKYTLSQVFIDKVSDTIAPEKSWNEPTLFEVLNDLLSSVNCVVTLSDFWEISLLDLDVRGDVIDITKLNNIRTTKSISDSASALEMTASNVIGQRRNATTGGWIGLRTLSDTVMSVENAVLKLDNPIYSVEKIVVIQQPYFINARFMIDISSQILEKKVWDRKQTSNQTGDIDDADGGRDYKRNFIWFEEGSYLIQGFGFKESNWLPFNANKTALKYAVNRASLLPVNSGENVGEFEDIYDFGNCLFYVEYTTIDNVKYRSYKTKEVSYESILVDNQETSYVDALSLGKKQQQKVDAIGNKQTMCFGKYKSTSDVPKLGDIYKDVHILTERTLVENDNFIQFSGVLTENYVGKNKFTGVNSRKRYTAYASEGDSALSNHIKSIELSFDFVNNNSIYPELENYMITFGTPNKRLSLAIAQTSFNGETYIDKFRVGGDCFIFGKGLVFQFKMLTSSAVGLKLEQVDAGDWFSADIHKMKYVDYVDYNGRFQTIKYDLFTELPLDGIEDALIADDYIPFLLKSMEYPLVSEDDIDYTKMIYTSRPMKRFKDSREITAETIQFNIRGKDGMIFLGDKFYEYNNMIYRENTQLSLTFRYSYGLEFDGYEVDITQWNIDANQDINFIDNYIQVENAVDSQVSWAQVTSWCLTDDNNNIIIAVNSNAQIIYLNTLDNSEKLVSTIIASASVSMSFVKALNYSITANINADASVFMNFRKAVNYGIAVDVNANASVSMNFSSIQFFGVVAGATANATVSMNFSKVVNYELTADASAIATVEMSFSQLQLVDYSLTADVNASAVVDMSFSGGLTDGPVDWIAVQQKPLVGDETCDDINDLGNVKYVPAGCVFNAVTTYDYPVNATTSIPPCSEGATYTLCFYSTKFGTWVCTDYEGDATVELYYECKLV